MAGVEQIPGIWDYLGQGVNNFVKARTDKQDKDRVEAMQRAQMLSSLYGAGAITSGSLQNALSTSGIPGFNNVQVLPSKQEQTNTLINNAPPDAKAELQYEAAGMKSPADIIANRKRTDAEAASAQAKASVDTEQATEYSANAAARRALTKMDTNDKEATVYSEVGKRYVAGILTKSGGRINSAKASDVAMQAYQAYQNDRQSAGLAALDDPVGVKAYFDLAAQNAIIGQRSQDAQAAAAADRTQPSDRVLSHLMIQEQNAANEAAQIMKDVGVGGQQYLDADPTSVPQVWRAQVKQYQTIQAYRANLRKAMTSLEPSDIQKIIGGPPGATAAATQSAAPASSNNPDMNTQQYQQFKATTQQLPEGLRAEWIERKKSVLSAGDYARLKKDFGIP